MNKHTIAAIATPPGKGGIGIIRISGNEALRISEKVLRKKPKDRIAEFSRFYDINGSVIDEGIALFFKGPNSFTGEDVLELQGHGGSFVLESVLEAVINFGARAATPGEFSKRSFLNGKIDLVQAESILSLINAKSEETAREAIKSLQGGLSKKLKNISQKITALRVAIESIIDFSDDASFIVEDSTISKANKLLNLLNDVISSLQTKSSLNENLNIAILGRPNSGKSSILNALSGQNTSIVTDIPGTTRDVLKENVRINGVPVVIIDMAGTRHSKFLSMENSINRIEQQGIKQIKSTIVNSDILLLLEDKTLDFEEESIERFVDFIKKPHIVVENKVDLVFIEDSLYAPENIKNVKVSAKNLTGINFLKSKIKQLISSNSIKQENMLTARRRHIEALRMCRSAIMSAMTNLENFTTIDLVAEDLREAQKFIFEITGEVTNEDILSDIFKGFCIGK